MREETLDTLGYFLFIMAAGLADLGRESLNRLNTPNTEK